VIWRIISPNPVIPDVFLLFLPLISRQLKSITAINATGGEEVIF